MSAWIRVFHRWVSIIFVLDVVVTFVAMAQRPPMVWVSYTPLLPLALLALTGMYMFFLPYVTAWRGRRG
jgi:hypothetical protein